MKKVTKALLLLLAVALICTAAGFYAVAESSNESVTGKEQDSTYRYQVFVPTTENGTEGTVTKYTTVDSFVSHIKNSKSGTVITLLSDVSVESEKDAAIEVRDTKYLDLNGYSLTFTETFSDNSNDNASCGFMGAEDSAFYVYSSDSDYTARINTQIQQEFRSAKSMPIFNLRYDNSSVCFGTVSDAPVVPETASETAGVTISFSGKYDGDNIATYSSALFSSYKARYRKNPENATISIYGGTHYIVSGSRAAINTYSAVDVTVADATFISTVGGPLFSTWLNMSTYTDTTSNVTNYIAPADGNLLATNCKFYTTGAVIEEAYESSTVSDEYDGGINPSSIVFNGCYFEGSKVLASNENNGKPDFNNCYFSSTVSLPGTDNVMANANKSASFTVPSIEYTYTDGLLSATTLTGSQTVKTVFNMKSATEGNYVTVTWSGYGETKDTYWDIDENLTPSPYFVPESNEIYKYVYSSAILPATQNAEYELIPSINFPFKTNLTLYAHFVYNVYIPKDIADSEALNSVSLGGNSCKLEKTAELDGEQYYVISYEVSAEHADKSFDLVMNIDGYNETFDYTKALSIPDYVEAIKAGGYSDEAKALVDSAYTYIKAAHNYYSDAEIYSISGLEPITGTPAESVDSSLADVLYGVSLSLDGKIKFRIYIYDNVDASKKNLTVSYQENNVIKDVALSESDFTSIDGTDYAYYDISVAAFDLRDRFYVKASDGTSYPYSLANYIYSVQDEGYLIKTLMNALWAYSTSAKAYADVFNSQTPDVKITVGGSEIGAIVAVTDEEIAAAEIIQNAIKTMTGTEVPISATESDGANIIISLSEPAGDYDCQIYVDGCDLTLKCGYKSFVNRASYNFANDYLLKLNGARDFDESFTEAYHTTKIYYSDFGAVGDGITNDFFAMKAAHDTANATKRHTVCADSGKTYLIEDTRDESGTVNSIKIQTNVNWTDAEIIIKDTDFYSWDGTGVTNANIFLVVPDTSHITISENAVIETLLDAGFGTETTKIGLNLGKAAMIVPFNTAHKVFRRIGYGSFEGQEMHEVIIIDEYGNVNEETPIIYDYSNIDYINVYSIDDTPITIEGGTITTMASHVDTVKKDDDGNVIGTYSTYIQRGFSVSRPNTTFKGVKHYVEGEITMAEQAEGQIGAPYHGFFSTNYAHNVLFSDCVLTGRRCYSKTYVSGAGSGTTGTYDYTINNSNRVVFQNCVQSNFWIVVDEDGNLLPATEDTPGAQSSLQKILYTPTTETGKEINFKRFWGLGGANHSKNMQFFNSVISRFDAHAGLWNAKIIDSDVGAMSIVGGGEAIIENTRWFGEHGGGCDSVIELRSDYGSPWNGTITLKDCTAYPHKDYNFSIIGLSYNNWYYGYEVCFPNLVIDNMTILDSDGNSIVDENGEPLSDYVSDSNNIFDANGKIRLLSVDGTDNLLDKEPNLHLAETSATAPIFAYVDEDKDGYVDDIGDVYGENVVYDKTYKEGNLPTTGTVYSTSDGTYTYEGILTAAGGTGLTIVDSCKNLNPVRPPESIIITDDVYDYYIPYGASANTTFFENTYISINGETVNGEAPPEKTVPEVTAPTAIEGLVYNGSTQALINAGSTSGGTIMYRLGATGEYSTEIPTATKPGTYTVYYKVVGGEDYADVAAASVLVTIDKLPAEYTAPTAIEGLVYTGNAQQLVNAGVTSCGTFMYKVGTNSAYSTNLPTATGAGTYTVYYKLVGNDYYKDVAEASISVTIGQGTLEYTAPTAVEGLSYNGSAQVLINAGTVGSGTFMYKLEGGEYSVNLPTATDAGEYTVYYKIVSNGNYSDTPEESITVTIDKEAPSFTAPTSVEGLVYTGEALVLINTGTTDDGTFMYRLEGGEYSTEIPTAIKAGTYTVYYMVVGDENHGNTAEASVTVVIKPKSQLMESPFIQN